MRVLGFMSGTSLDGVDGAILETDGDNVTAFGPARSIAYTNAERAALEAAVAKALAPSFQPPGTDDFVEAETVILDAHLRLGRELLRAGGTVDLIGYHGQTVLHRPEQRLTLQIGSPQALAQALGVPVIADLRLRDIEEGGQGAPIVPVYHMALANAVGLEAPVAFLNIGGVSNISWIGPNCDLQAFDVGPGNGLIDQWVAAHGLGTYDEDGRLACAGTPRQDIVLQMMSHPFFQIRGPKSLDRYDFSLGAVRPLSVEDGAATLVAFTAEAVASATATLPAPPRLWVLCGGGRHNRALRNELEKRIGACHLAEDFGFRGDVVEAEAMAYLAARSAQGLPITFPGTTGVGHPVTGGIRYWPT